MKNEELISEITEASAINKEEAEVIVKYGEDILKSERFERAFGICHHRTHCTAEHSLNVAGASCKITEWLNRHGFSISENDVVRASLLHDIGMTEKEVREKHQWKLAYTHPKAGGQIAQDEYDTNDSQLDAVRRHMWPLCIIPPVHIAGWIITVADKYTAVRELAR